jgi:hypothetical protein
VNFQRIPQIALYGVENAVTGHPEGCEVLIALWGAHGGWGGFPGGNGGTGSATRGGNLSI